MSDHISIHPLWNKKTLALHSLLLWDIENIPINALQLIKQLVKCTPYNAYAISQYPIDEVQRTFLEQEGIRFIPTYPECADKTLCTLILEAKQRITSLIFVSSDGDFVPYIKEALKNCNVLWIMQDCNKKRICMNIDLSHPRLTLSSIDSEDKRVNRHSKKRKKPAFYAPTRTSFSNEAYWLNYFSRYHAHIG